MAWPIPELPPVTSTFLPFRPCIGLPLPRRPPFSIRHRWCRRVGERYTTGECATVRTPGSWLHRSEAASGAVAADGRRTPPGRPRRGRHVHAGEAEHLRVGGLAGHPLF